MGKTSNACIQIFILQSSCTAGSPYMANYSTDFQTTFFKTPRFKDNNGISSISIFQEHQYLKH